MNTMRADLPYLCEYGGRTYARHGRKIKIEATKGTEAFAREYTAALDKLEGRPAPTTYRLAPKGSLGWLAREWESVPRPARSPAPPFAGCPR